MPLRLRHRYCHAAAPLFTRLMPLHVFRCRCLHVAVIDAGAAATPMLRRFRLRRSLMRALILFYRVVAVCFRYAFMFFHATDFCAMPGACCRFISHAAAADTPFDTRDAAPIICQI